MSRVMRAILTAAAGLGAGCEAQTITPPGSEGRIQIAGSTLAAHIRVVQQDSDRIEGGLLRIRTELKNRIKEDLWVDVQVVWKDGQGYEVYKTNWAPLYLPARLVQTHEVASLRPDVADYEFRMRRVARPIR